MQPHQLLRQRQNEIAVAGLKAIVDVDVAFRRPREPLEFLAKCLKDYPRVVGGDGHEHADAPYPARLLRVYCERPCDRPAAEKRNEVASPHPLSPHPPPASFPHPPP